ncbi:hypothetical protein BH10PSE18_BH10PSE18_41750 [soil metagenome]
MSLSPSSFSSASLRSLASFGLTACFGVCCMVGSAWAAPTDAAQKSPLPAAAVAPARVLAAQSRIAFVSKQMGVPVEGAFGRFDAQIAFDPRKPEGGTVMLQIDMASASLGVPQSDAELPKALWFDTAKFPKAVFQSTAIRALGGGRFEVTGTLTLKGHVQPLVVPVAITQSGDSSLATGAFALQRLEFRIGDGEWTDTSIVANEVQVNFKLALAGFGPL